MQTTGLLTYNSVAQTLMLIERLFLDIRFKWSTFSSPVNVLAETAEH